MSRVLRFFRQLLAISLLNLRSVPQRLPTSVAAVAAIALVVLVLLGALTLERSFARTLDGSGSDDVAVVMRKGATSEIASTVTREQANLLSEAPGLAEIGGQPAISAEFVVAVDAIRKDDGTRANLPLRGVDATAMAVRRDVGISQGRLFRPGSDEIVVGANAQRAYAGLELGKTVTFGSNRWQIVGVLDAGSGVLASEAWGDLAALQSLYNQGGDVQSVRMRLTAPASLGALEDYVGEDPRLQLAVQSEREFYRGQASGVADLIIRIGRPLALIMAFGALAGSLNAMYASISERAREIATLRTIGFSRTIIFLGTVTESLVLALGGALLGVLLAIIVFDGMTATTLGAGFTQVVFEMKLSGGVIGTGVLWAVVVGLLGGAVPALIATRRPILVVME